MTRKSRRESDSSTRLPLHWVKCIKDIDCIPCMPSKDLISMWTFVFEGVFMAMWVEYLILASPSAFPWFYLVCVNFRFLKIVNGWSIYPLFLFSILSPNPRWLWYFWCCWDTRPTARSTTTSSCSTSATSCKSLWSRKPFSSLQPPVLGRPGSKPTLLSGQESFLFCSFTHSLLYPQPWSDCDCDTRLAELDGVPQLGQDDQLLHPHHATAHVLHAGVGKRF